MHPNPLVGAVLVKNGRVIGQGAHERFGGPHAEVQAICSAKDSAGATLYVTLEPCPHFGKTPPCTELILKAGVKEVVVASTDPNPKVKGSGLAFLKKAGLRVRAGLLKEEAEALNKDYNRWIRTGKPYVVVKYAQSLDGKIHDAMGGSRWISGSASRGLAQELRAKADAIVVGINTLLSDDPLLSVRLKGYRGRQPIKVVVDNRLRTPNRARIFSKASPGPVLIATIKRIPAAKKRVQKAEILKCPALKGRVDLKFLFDSLGRRGIVNILVEGGAEVIADVLSRDLAQEVYCFTAPKVIANLSVSQAPALKESSVQKIGEDFLIRGTF